MSFKSVQKQMAKGGVGMERAGAMLASRTRKTMKAHGLSTAHGIPKNVFNKKTFKKGSPNKAVGHHCLRSVGALE